MDLEALASDLRDLLGVEGDLPEPRHGLASEADLRDMARELLHGVIGLEVEP